MGAPSDTRLSTFMKVRFFSEYIRKDLPMNSGNRDDLRFDPVNLRLENGRGNSKANLLYYDRRRLINTSETLDLDGVLLNKWGFLLNYDAVKQLIIKNTEAVGGTSILDVTFKNERYLIGANGTRIVNEPGNKGIQAAVMSGSSEEGNITLTATGDVTYDIVIVGSDLEQSTSSSGV